MRGERGFTIAEMLVSLIIFGLMLVAIGSLAGPIMSAPSAGSAKTDTVSSAAYGLDVMERDIRETDVTGAWSCTTGATVTCSQPTSLTVSPYIAVLSACDAFGVFDPTGPGNAPKWKAYIVYSHPAGTSVIYRTYWAWTTTPTTWQSGAVAAVSAASALPAGTVVSMPNAQSMSLSVNTANSQISLQVATAAGAGAAANSTSYSTIILARN